MPKFTIYAASTAALAVGALLVAGASPMLRALGIVMIGIAALMILLTMATSDPGRATSRFGVED